MKRIILSKFRTIVFVLKHGGLRELAFQLKVAARKRIGKIDITPKARDVLIVSIDEPLLDRYRSQHMMEELESAGLTVDKIFYHQLDSSHAKFYNTFIFYRCPWMENYDEFFQEAKKRNKALIYTVDDLVIDTKYTDDLPTVKNMSKSDKKLYDEGVIRYGKVMEKCDYAIATTGQIAEEFSKFDNFKEVFINRNAASQEMIFYAEKAQREILRDGEKIIIGYFSGTSTHNEDFQMIAPALTQIMDENSDVFVKLAGRIDAPQEFKGYEDRIIFTPYVDWRELPRELAKCDIILAPLVDSIFNRAKSEIKWMEAALVGVPVVASDMGSFREVLRDGETAILSKNTTSDWKKSICQLIDDKELRQKIARKSKDFALKNYQTIGRNATELRDFIDKITPEVYCFSAVSLADISGGNIVVKKHMDTLRRAGKIVYAVESLPYQEKDKWLELNRSDDENFDIFRIGSGRRADKIDLDMTFDKMVATFWSSNDFVKKYPRLRNENSNKKYLVQGYEIGFYDDAELRGQVASTYSDQTVDILTVSKWCQDWLKSDFGRSSDLILNGIELDGFEFKDRKLGKKVKILIEGNCLAKNKKVDESFEIVKKLDREKFEISYLTYNGEVKDWYDFDNIFSKVSPENVAKIYANHDILIKSSIAESFSLPPLEMMATGGVVVLAENEGNSSYAKNGKNCLTYESGDIEAAAKLIAEISSSKEKFAEISRQARRTAEEFNWKNREKEILEIYEK